MSEWKKKEVCNSRRLRYIIDCILLAGLIFIHIPSTICQRCFSFKPYIYTLTKNQHEACPDPAELHLVCGHSPGTLSGKRPHLTIITIRASLKQIQLPSHGCTSHNEDKCGLEASSKGGIHFALKCYCLLIRVTFGQFRSI